MSLILIIANSARMLAQAAYKVGLKPLVIDLYADQDTQKYSLVWRKIQSLAPADLIPAITDLLAQHAVTDVIYGSGFEQYLESLTYLCSQFTVLGNTAETFEKIQNKANFFAECDELAIGYPTSSFVQPIQTEGWLIKPLQGLGGVGIKQYQTGQINDDAVYWQKFQTGSQHSVLFLANAVAVQIIGFNTQWTVNNKNDADFTFAGITNSNNLTDSHKTQIQVWLNKLVPRFSLLGLNSLDFIRHGESIYLLEVNPRLPASMQLYDANLIEKHILACKGFLSHYLAAQVDITGYQIVYAKQNVVIPDGFIWPEWCLDIPASATLIHTGQPICSIIAHKIQPEQVLAQLMLKQNQIIKQLER